MTIISVPSGRQSGRGSFLLQQTGDRIVGKDGYPGAVSKSDELRLLLNFSWGGFQILTIIIIYY